MERKNGFTVAEYKPEPAVHSAAHEVPGISTYGRCAQSFGRRMDVNELVVSGDKADWLVKDVGALVAERD